MGLDQAVAELRGGMTTSFWLLGHFCIGLAGTWLARRYAVHRNLVDLPGKRRSHVLPTPRGGGIAIAVALLAAAAWVWVWAPTFRPLLAGFLPGVMLVAGIGGLDDHRPLSPWLRLAVHAMAALTLATGVWLATGSAWLAVAAFVLAMVLTNVWNFMDGIDGLAASQTVLVAAGVALLADGPVRWLALALLSATIGFLPFNFPKARIFLGDVGSGTSGYTLAMLVVAATGQETAGLESSWWLWSLPLSAFLLDAGLTLLGRMTRRETWWQPHTLHAYQGWARRSRSHVPVTLAYAAWTALALGLLVWLRGATPLVMLLSCLAWYMTGTGVWWMLQRKRTMAAMEHKE
jgi:UDP-N-acetylmuramyl pentapeptide phosphotransferase/UDP-N-acetylglucosamine-1-phosphate transferase